MADLAPSTIDPRPPGHAALKRSAWRSKAKHTRTGARRTQPLPPTSGAGGAALVIALIALLAAPAASIAARNAHAGSLRAASAPGSATRGRRTQRGHRKPPPFLAAISRLRTAGEISSSAAASYRSTYSDARYVLSRLHGAGAEELGAVIAGLEAIASRGELQAALLPSLLATLDRNLEWWPAHPAPAYGVDLTFPGTYLVFERYPGQGLQIQWLASFGRANGYYQAGQTPALAALLREALSMAAPAAGGIGWDYLFAFDSGAPPWRSALTQATALEALARAYERTHEASFLEAANAALHLFQAPPPEGVRTPVAAGPWYAQYTFAPEDHVINGFIQALVGLYEYTQITGSPDGAALFAEGDRTARAMLPDFNTGAWSRYDQYHESDLAYHKLLTEFLAHLCALTSSGEPLARFEYKRALAARHIAGGSAAAPPPTPPVAIAGDQIYCETASELQSDLHTPPRLALLTHSLAAGAPGSIVFSLSKVAALSFTISRSGHTYLAGSFQAEAGKRSIRWRVPARAGTYTLALDATDLAGNHSELKLPLNVRARRRRSAGRAHPRT